jgi:7,8-dihydropterin-6-yl-methyl-4-(beta-D-ribofuranosyl)aminobenzene 5'-phosphate synthase
MNGAAQVLSRGALAFLAGTFALLAPAQDARPRITVLYDAFGNIGAMQKDWGYAAFIEFAGKRILFDTGNNPGILESNAKARGIDLSRLDFIVMSHRHGDHMGGLAYVLDVNPGVKIYAPKEGFGVYGGDLPGNSYRRDTTLPPEQRYYNGSPPDIMRFGSAWPDGHFQLVNDNSEIAPGTHLITLVSDKPGTLELRELSLVISTLSGLVVMVGCSHPGIDKIMDEATKLNKHVRLIMGGFHLVTSSDKEIADAVTVLHGGSRWITSLPAIALANPRLPPFERRSVITTSTLGWAQQFRRPN